jgi:cytochrome P450
VVVDHSAQPPAEFDPVEPSFVANPLPHYARLRNRCPVAHSDRWDFWVLTRYEDIVAAATRPRVFSSEWGITVPPNRVSGRRAPMHFDPPEHTRVRRAMNAPFRDERLHALEPQIRSTARELLGPLVGNPGAEFATGYAGPLTGRVLAAFLGLAGNDGDFLDAHSTRFEEAQFTGDLATAESENLLLYDFARDLVAARRARPLPPRDDLVSALLELADDDGSGDEFVAGSLRQLFIAGHVAPRIAISAAIRHLAGDRDLQDTLRARPDLLPAATEELLRLHTPNQGFARTAREDVVVRGRTIRAGQQVAFAYPSANRDEQVFPRADEFDLTRRNNRHLAFGSGVHKCVGATLARIELRAAVGELLAATESFRPAAESRMIGWPLTGPADVRLITVPRR